MVINIKKTSEEAITPTKGSAGAAGYDLYALTESDVREIPAGETAKIGTGIRMEIPEGYFGAVFARSGLATKQGLRPANCVGVIDSDYRGEIIVAIHNDSHETKVISKGDRIAQLVIVPYLTNTMLKEVDELNTTKRGDGGFGSTGVGLCFTSEYIDNRVSGS